MFFKKKFSLAQYGDEFKDSYITVKLLDGNQSFSFIKKIAKLSNMSDLTNDEEAIKRSEEIIKLTYGLVKDSFVEGSIFDEKQREMTKEDIDSFPVEIIKDVSAIVRGNMEKKS